MDESETVEPLRVGGVPEHFNFPWHHARRQGWYKEAGLDVSWRNFAEGTGAMATALAAGQLDVAIALSEGAVAAIGRGVPARIVGWAVTSPLIWGIHSPPGAAQRCLADVRQTRFAISRYGSGSHLMAHVLCDQQGWTRSEFVVVDNLHGAIDAFAQQRADLFLWERFTTQPHVDLGAMARIGQIPTPWPAFCVLVSEQALATRPRAIGKLWQVANRSFAAVSRLVDLAAQIARDFDLRQAQVEAWLKLTHWGDGAPPDDDRVTDIIERLDALNLLDRPVSAADCIFRWPVKDPGP